MEKLKRYLVFLVGLFINSLGVSLITKADLGTSPISSIPYVLSLNFPFTLGQFTIAFSLLLILIQLVILRRNFKAEHLLQIPIWTVSERGPLSPLCLSVSLPACSDAGSPFLSRFSSGPGKAEMRRLTRFLPAIQFRWALRHRTRS